MKGPFAGKTIIISGGLGDIGRAMAQEFGLLGGSVALGDLYPPRKAATVIAAMTSKKIRCHYTQVDVTDFASVRRWVEEVRQKVGLPEIIIPNAATVTLATFAELTAEQWQREIQVNLHGAFNLAKAGVEQLVARRRKGKVLFIGSWAADHVHVHIPAYCVSKAGLRMLTRCLALELAPRGILVNELAPGIVDAGLSRKVQKQNPGLRKKTLGKIPLRQLIAPAEVAREAVHLCHPDNQNITGSTLVMDGGCSLLA